MGTDPAMQKRFSTLKLPRSRVWNILTPFIHENLSATVLQPVIGTLLTGCLQEHSIGWDFGNSNSEIRKSVWYEVTTTMLHQHMLLTKYNTKRALVWTLYPCHHFLRRPQILQEQLLRTCFFFPLKIDEMTLDRHSVPSSQFAVWNIMIVSGSLALISCFLAGITYRPPSSSMSFDRHAFVPVCVLPHIFFLSFLLFYFLLFLSFFPFPFFFLFVFLLFGSPATFFTRERVACLWLYDSRVWLPIWAQSNWSLAMLGWNFDSSRLTGDPPGRVVCVLRRVLKAGSREASGSTFIHISAYCAFFMISWFCFSEGKWFSLQAMNRFTLSSLAFRFGSAEFVLVVSPFLLFPVGVSICITSHPRSYKTLLWYRR